MKCVIIASTLLAAASAFPNGPIEARQGSVKVCPPLDSALCCEAVVEGILGLTCSPPPKTPKSVKAFSKMCEKTGLGANCCTLDADGAGVVCSAVG